MTRADEHKLMRRVAGQHNLRLDGIQDLLSRARGASVLDVGCNRGAVGYEFAQNGAALVNGCDNYAQGIAAAKEWFVDLRAVFSQFEIVDLTKGSEAMAPFGSQHYDIVVMLATYHKLKRVMPPAALSELMIWLGKRTEKWFAWRGNGNTLEGAEEMALIDSDMMAAGLKRVHTSCLSLTLGIAAIWARQ